MKIQGAERVAIAITEEYNQGRALAAIAEALAATDPDHGERVAQSITSEHWKSGALVHIARALAATNPDRAERLARSITQTSQQVETLAAIVEIRKGHH